MIKVLESNLCKINYSESLSAIANDTVVLLNEKANEYKALFGYLNHEQIIINYFDNIEDFRNFIYEIRGEKHSLPNYARGTYDKGMINAYINPEIQLNKRYTASHELFHILYMKHILNNDYSKRVIWYDEGMAQFMSGEKDELDNENNFETFYQKVKSQTKTIPILNDIKHGDSFCNDDYDGYDLSYLSVRYLAETLSDNQFKELMSNFSEIQQIGNDVIFKMFNYFDQKFNIDKYRK